MDIYVTQVGSFNDGWHLAVWTRRGWRECFTNEIFARFCRRYG